MRLRYIGRRKQGLLHYADVPLCPALLLMAMLLIAVAVAPQSVRAATANAEKTEVFAGTKLLIRGSGFNPSERIVSWASSEVGSIYETESTFADGRGNAELTITIKRFWAPVWWAVTLHGQDSSRDAVAGFKILQSPPDGALDVAPTTVQAGRRIDFHGAGFAVNEKISIWATNPEGKGIAFSTNLIQRDREINFHFEVPLDAPLGRWYMTAYGLDSERLLVGSFTVAR